MYITNARLKILKQFEHRQGVFWSAEISIEQKVICTVEQKGSGGVNFYYNRTPEWKMCKQEILSLFNPQGHITSWYPPRAEELVDAVVTYTGHNETLEQGLQRYRTQG